MPIEILDRQNNRREQQQKMDQPAQRVAVTIPMPHASRTTKKSSQHPWARAGRGLQTRPRA